MSPGEQISNFASVKTLEGLEETRILELVQVGIIRRSSTMRNDVLKKVKKKVNIGSICIPSFFPPCSLYVSYPENTHTQKVIESENYTAVSGRTGITVVLTPRDFSRDLLHNLAEGFSTV